MYSFDKECMFNFVQSPVLTIKSFFFAVFILKSTADFQLLSFFRLQFL